MCCTVKTWDRNPKFRTRVARSPKKHRASGRSGPFPEESKLLNPPRPEMGDWVVKRRETLTGPTPRGMGRGRRKGPRLHRHQLASLRPHCTPLPALSPHRRACRLDARASSWPSIGRPPSWVCPGPFSTRAGPALVSPAKATAAVELLRAWPTSSSPQPRGAGLGPPAVRQEPTFYENIHSTSTPSTTGSDAGS